MRRTKKQKIIKAAIYTSAGTKITEYFIEKEFSRKYIFKSMAIT